LRANARKNIFSVDDDDADDAKEGFRRFPTKANAAALLFPAKKPLLLPPLPLPLQLLRRVMAFAVVVVAVEEQENGVIVVAI
jgi:hypothetical protein